MDAAPKPMPAKSPTVLKMTGKNSPGTGKKAAFKKSRPITTIPMEMGVETRVFNVRNANL